MFALPIFTVRANYRPVVVSVWWGASQLPPAAGERRRASGSGRQKTSLLRQEQFSPGTATGLLQADEQNFTIIEKEPSRSLFRSCVRVTCFYG